MALLSTVLLLFLLGTSVVAFRPTLDDHVDGEASPDPNPTRRPQALELHNNVIHTITGLWYRLPTKVQNTFSQVLHHASHNATGRTHKRA
jgi:hypothetical protein